MGAARQAACDRAGVRPPRQHRERHRTASRARHVGARLLSAIRKREGGLGGGLLEDRQLGGCPSAPTEGSHPRSGAIDETELTLVQARKQRSYYWYETKSSDVS